jgi:ABC-type transport system involved in multi-copper enzyme maturation permease subunit
MSLSLIFYDELKGFYKSKVMIALWIIFPVIALLIHYISSLYTEGAISVSSTVSLVISSIGGLIASIMLTVSIIHEKDARVYDLFLIRPIKRWYILISKFFAVFICVTVAGLLALSIGILSDYILQNELILDVVLPGIIDSFIMTISTMAISCSFGVLIGVIAPSIVVGVIIVIFIGEYINIIPIIPVILEIENSDVFVTILSILITVIMMIVSVVAFNKKQF